jgi:hypothetical protein
MGLHECRAGRQHVVNDDKTTARQVACGAERSGEVCRPICLVESLLAACAPCRCQHPGVGIPDAGKCSTAESSTAESGTAESSTAAQQRYGVVSATAPGRAARWNGDQLDHRPWPRRTTQIEGSRLGRRGPRRQVCRRLCRHREGRHQRGAQGDGKGARDVRASIFFESQDAGTHHPDVFECGVDSEPVQRPGNHTRRKCRTADGAECTVGTSAAGTADGRQHGERVEERPCGDRHPARSRGAVLSCGSPCGALTGRTERDEHFSSIVRGAPARAGPSGSVDTVCESSKGKDPPGGL